METMKKMRYRVIVMRLQKIVNIELRSRRWEWNLTHQTKLICITQDTLNKNDFLWQKERRESEEMET